MRRPIEGRGKDRVGLFEDQKGGCHSELHLKVMGMSLETEPSLAEVHTRPQPQSASR